MVPNDRPADPRKTIGTLWASPTEQVQNTLLKTSSWICARVGPLLPYIPPTHLLVVHKRFPLRVEHYQRLICSPTMAAPVIGNTGNKVFAPSILFIAWREAMEASLVIGILLASVETLVKDDLPLPSNNRSQNDPDGSSEPSSYNHDKDSGVRALEGNNQTGESNGHVELERKVLIRHLRKAIFLGAFIGLMMAFAIGAAFLAVFYTQVNDLYGKAEELWYVALSCLFLVLPYLCGVFPATDRYTDYGTDALISKTTGRVFST